MPPTGPACRPATWSTKLNDFETTSPDGLIAAVRFYAPGTEVTVTYTRDGGDPQTVTATLASR